MDVIVGSSLFLLCFLENLKIRMFIVCQEFLGRKVLFLLKQGHLCQKEAHLKPLNIMFYELLKNSQQNVILLITHK